MNDGSLRVVNGSLGVSKQTRRIGGLIATQAEFGPHFVVRPHEHVNLSLILFLSGDLEGRWPSGKVARRPLSVSVDPFDEIAEPRIGPAGISIVLLEFDGNTADAYGVSRKLVGCPKLLRDARAVRLSLDLAMNLQSGCDVDLEQSAVEMCALFTTAPDSARKPRWLASAMDMIESEFRFPIGLREIAQFAGIDPTHLARTFRAAVGCSVGTHICRLRLSETTRLYLEGASLEQAAISSGFTDYSHFRRRFLDRFEVSPQSLKQLLKRPRVSPRTPVFGLAWDRSHRDGKAMAPRL